jgi:hypothetical protein
MALGEEVSDFVVRDLLAGNNRRNQLDGHQGRDTLIGRGGNDRFGWGPFRRDTRYGSEGDVITCGRGEDMIRPSPSHRLHRAACETLEFRNSLPPTPGAVTESSTSAYPATVTPRVLTYQSGAP